MITLLNHCHRLISSYLHCYLHPHFLTTPNHSCVVLHCLRTHALRLILPSRRLVIIYLPILPGVMVHHPLGLSLIHQEALLFCSTYYRLCVVSSLSYLIDRKPGALSPFVRYYPSLVWLSCPASLLSLRHHIYRDHHATCFRLPYLGCSFSFSLGD